jgi:hypothetical protein
MQTLKPANIIIFSFNKIYLFFEQKKTLFIMAVSHIEARGKCVLTIRWEMLCCVSGSIDRGGAVGHYAGLQFPAPLNELAD